MVKQFACVVALMLCALAGCRSVTVQLDDPSATLFVDGDDRGRGRAEVQLRPLTNRLLVATRGGQATVAYLRSDGSVKPAAGAKEAPLRKGTAENHYVMRSSPPGGQAYIWPSLCVSIWLSDSGSRQLCDQVIAIAPGFHMYRVTYLSSQAMAKGVTSIPLVAQPGRIYKIDTEIDYKASRVIYKIRDYTNDAEGRDRNTANFKLF